MDATRRALLGAAALGAGGLALTQALAAEKNDTGRPGDGGYGRNAVQLPAGAKVAYHDPKDIEEMPNYVFSLDGNDPKITSGGWAKESTVHQLPVSKGIAGVHMFLNPGASRELHWHAIAAEWAYVIDGRCQTMVLEPSGASEINNFEPGDLWYFAKGHGHSIQCIGDKPCHFVLSFDNGAFSEHGTFSITDWINVTPKEILAANFNLPKDLFDAFPKGEYVHRIGTDRPRLAGARGALAARVHAQIQAAERPEGSARFRRRHVPDCQRRRVSGLQDHDGRADGHQEREATRSALAHQRERMAVLPGRQGAGVAVRIRRPQQGRRCQDGRRGLHPGRFRTRDQKYGERGPRDRADVGQRQVRGD